MEYEPLGYQGGMDRVAKPEAAVEMEVRLGHLAHCAEPEAQPVGEQTGEPVEISAAEVVFAQLGVRVDEKSHPYQYDCGSYSRKVDSHKTSIFHRRHSRIHCHKHN